MDAENVIQTLIGNILRREGGVVQNATEGYTTYWGQTPAWLAQWRLPIPTSRDEAAMNYRSWLEQTNLDDLCTEADALPDVVVDYAINSGEGQAIKALQSAVGVKADGLMGPKTLIALQGHDRRQVAQFVLADRLAFLGNLLARLPEKHIFAAGWLVRVAAQVRTLS